LAKSQNILPTCTFWLKNLNTLSISLKAGFTVDLSCLKPNYSGTGMLLVCL